MAFGKIEPEKLLEALKNPDVQAAIRAICRGDPVTVAERVPEAQTNNEKTALKVRDLENKLAEAETCVRSLQAENEAYKGDARQLKRRLSELESELRVAAQDVKRMRDENESGIGRFKPLYERYLSIPSRKRQNWSNNINGETLLSFVASGAQDRNLDSFWNLCLNEFQNGSGSDAEILVDMFDAFFDLVNSLGKTPRYRRLAVKAGERYKSGSREYTVDSSSAPSGVISRVLLQGYARYEGEIVAKSYIHVGE